MFGLDILHIGDPPLHYRFVRWLPHARPCDMAHTWLMFTRQNMNCLYVGVSQTPPTPAPSPNTHTKAAWQKKPWWWRDVVKRARVEEGKGDLRWHTSTCYATLAKRFITSCMCDSLGSILHFVVPYLSDSWPEVTMDFSVFVFNGNRLFESSNDDKCEAKHKVEQLGRFRK